MRPASQPTITRVALCRKRLGTHSLRWYAVNVSSLDTLALASECMYVQLLCFPFNYQFLLESRKGDNYLYVFVLTRLSCGQSIFSKRSVFPSSTLYRALVGSVLHRYTCSKMTLYSQTVWDMKCHRLPLKCVTSGSSIAPFYMDRHLPVGFIHQWTLV